jgi:hypothetical protein
MDNVRIEDDLCDLCDPCANDNDADADADGTKKKPMFIEDTEDD